MNEEVTPSRASDENDTPLPAPNGPLRANKRDAELLDAYSQAVVSVVEAVAPAVISVRGDGQGAGSGFLISPDGFAITNSHVVSGRSQLVATTTEGDRIDAEVVGDDPATDIALLRLASSDLPYCEFGDSDALRVGQLVIAMGSPLGLDASISTGVVSALGRSLRGQDGRLIENVVQHSAPINPGNSGGPLLDSRGCVVGVNTAIIHLAQGLGFAVPGNTARWVHDEISGHGTVRRRQLGVVATTSRVAKNDVRTHDLLSDQAVLVTEVAPGSVAERSGVRSGDLIVEINDRLTTTVDDVHRILGRILREQPLELTVLRRTNRGSEKATVKVDWANS